jgi:hypothetical protein
MLLDPRECDVLQDSIGQSERAKRIHRRHPRVGIDGDGLIRWLRSLSGNEARIVSEHTPRRLSLPGIHPDSPDGARRDPTSATARVSPSRMIKPVEADIWAPLGNKLGTVLATSAPCGHNAKTPSLRRAGLGFADFKHHRNLFPMPRLRQTYRTQNPVLAMEANADTHSKGKPYAGRPPGINMKLRLTLRQEARERRIISDVKPFIETLRVTNPVRQSRASSRKQVLRGGG